MFEKVGFFRSGRSTDIQIVVLYVVFLILWIFGTDYLALSFPSNQTLQLWIAGFRRVGLIVISSLLLYLLLCIRRGEDPQQVGAQRGYGLRGLLIVFLALVLVVPGVGYSVVHFNGPQIRRAAFANLNAIAGLRTQQIEVALRDWRGDAEMLASTTGFIADLDSWVRLGDPNTAVRYRSRLASMERVQHFEAIAYDAKGRVVYGKDLDAPSMALLRPVIDEAIRTRKVQETDLYRNGGGRIGIDYVSPLVLPGADGPRVVAVVILRAPVEEVLLPLTHWPIPSDTAELTLVRREGNEIVFLNEPRHRQSTAQALRFPLDSPNLLEVKAVRSGLMRAQEMEGLDYRDVKVLAVAKPLKGTRWISVAKIDLSEATAGHAKLAAWISLVALVGVFVVIVALLLLWRQQQRANALAVMAAHKDRLEKLVAERTAALEESTRQFRQLVSQLPEAVVIHREGRFVYANEAASAITGFSREELLGAPLLNCFHPDEHAEILERMRRRDEGDVSSYETRVQARSGELRNILVKPQLTTFQGLPAWLEILEDITWHKRMERELREAKEAAEAANQAKSEFLANMSHEIRTPLNAVIGFAELLHASVHDPALQGYAESIRAAGRNLLTLIGDILDLSKIEAGRMEIHPEPLDLRVFLKELGQIYELRAREKGLELRVDVDEDVPGGLELDAVRTRQVVVNLVGNAIKFTHSGSVRVSAHALPSKGAGDLDLIVEVRDTGIGIPKEAQESVFESFRQQDGHCNRLYGGTGLGLFISRRLVNLMGGRLEVESEPGEGSTFRIYLPGVNVSAIPQPGSPSQTSIVAHGHFRFQPNRVLIADDVLSNRQLAAELLREASLEILEALDGVEAVELARREHPALVIMDIQMPRMDGIQAMQILKSEEATKSIPIIAYTASSRILVASEYLRLGFDGALIKPVSIEALLKELARHLPLEAGPPGAPESNSPKAARIPLPESALAELAPHLDACRGAIRPEKLRRLIQAMRGLAQDYPSLEAWASDLDAALARFDLPALKHLLADLHAS